MAKKKKDPSKKTASKKTKRAPKKSGSIGKRGAGAPKKKKKAKAAPRPPAPPRGATCHLVCSECYDEFTISAETLKNSDSISCPDCMHVGKRPDDEFIGIVQIHKGQESRMKLIALAIASLFLVASAVLIYSISPYTDEPVLDPTILGGIVGLLFLGTLGALWKYEGNRWEVYF